MRPGAPPKSCGYVFHGSRVGVFVGHRPPRDPGDPPLYEKKSIAEVLHLHRCYTHTLTILSHTTLSRTNIVTHTELSHSRHLRMYATRAHTFAIALYSLPIHLPPHPSILPLPIQSFNFCSLMGQKMQTQLPSMAKMRSPWFYHLRWCVPSGPNLRFG